jgi:hypothetical protein
MRRLLSIFAAIALVASAAPASGQSPLPAFQPCGKPLENVPPRSPRNVELATVTDTEFIVTWLTCNLSGAPVATDTTVTWFPLSDPTDRTTVTLGEPTPFHYARIAGLRPNTRYGYEVTSQGRVALPDRLHPGVFKTLPRPPGRELFSLGILADTHIGETVSGLATSTPFEFPPSYRSDRPYPEVMAQANVAGLNAQGVDFTILPADNTSHGELPDMLRLKEILDGLDSDYLLARGAHDRPNQYAKAKTECGPDGDCFRQVFRPEQEPSPEPRPADKAVEVGGYVIIALDSANLQTGTGQITAAQRAWLTGHLEAAKARGMPAIVFFHHPVAHYSTTLAVPPLIFGVNQLDANAFIQLIRRYDVRMVINAHTHRNWVAYDPRTGKMPFVEVGPSKEYPGGYSVLRVFEGGFLRTWFPNECAFCNAWRETTRNEYLSLYPLYTSGSLRDRNFIHRFAGPDVPNVPSLPTGVWLPFLCAA